MATPIAHKGATAGAKVMAMTTLDMLLNKKILPNAKKYFTDEQGKETTYQSFISADDKPATHLNAKIMKTYRPLLKEFYYNPQKYKSYLEQLGVEYPTIRK